MLVYPGHRDDTTMNVDTCGVAKDTLTNHVLVEIDTLGVQDMFLWIDTLSHPKCIKRSDLYSNSISKHGHHHNLYPY